ncbi:MAG: hypothetical protein IPJ24_02070 [bacterium]|nr:hypothetical protein [bacterium]
MNRRSFRIAVLCSALALLALLMAAVTGAASAAPAPAPAPTPTAVNPHGDMKLDCRLCHAEQSWAADAKSVPFDHATTGFILEGQHALVACRDCHKQPQFSHIGTRCADCHLDAHKNRLGPACEQCHTPAGWVERSQAQREHDTTRLPLVGAHAKVDCDACHTGAQRGEYLGTPSDCVACHQPDYEATRNPDHRLAGFTTDCDRCHGVFAANWGRGDFIHSLSFPLTGAHATTACASCHSETFVGTPTDCYACHQPDYDASANPPHATAGLGTTCVSCHGTSDWRPSTYDHALAPANYPLQGGHRGVDCASCHTAGYVATSTDCYACHRPDYEAAADPNHVAGGFPTDCTACHAVTTWNDSNFDHARTAFPLTGAHATQSCLECHAGGYTGTPTDCFACHQTNYAATTNPNHATANIPTTCVVCHSTTAWTPAQFDHGTTSFPLTGAHRNATCEACHATGYTGTPSDCYACHQADYTGATDPNHVASGYPTACVSCHSTTAWEPAQFDHNTTAFPLTGAHRNATCAECHGAGYAGTPTDCYACHQADYTQTNDPSHTAASFPTTCVTCHSTTAWTPSTWDHEPLFPIESGAHRNIDCAQCHVTPSNYSHFECILCHEHNQNDMANDHEGRRDYQWVSTACYTCHPDGRD